MARHPGSKACNERLYVHDSLYDAVCRALVAVARGVKLGNGSTGVRCSGREPDQPARRGPPRGRRCRHVRVEPDDVAHAATPTVPLGGCTQPPTGSESIVVAVLPCRKVRSHSLQSPGYCRCFIDPFGGIGFGEMRKAPKRLRARQRVERVLDATDAILLGNGLGTIAVDDIAMRAEVPIDSMYRYFDNRDEVPLARCYRRYRILGSLAGSYFARGVSDRVCTSPRPFVSREIEKPEPGHGFSTSREASGAWFDVIESESDIRTVADFARSPATGSAS